MEKIYQATGKRKTSVAQVVLLTLSKKNPKPKIIIASQNDNFNKFVPLHKYFPSEILVKNVLKPLLITKLNNKFSIKIKVKGGGFNGQSDATRHGIAKVLAQFSEENSSILKQNKLLTRDSRSKERKKYGLKKARKAPQFSKR